MKDLLLDRRGFCAALAAAAAGLSGCVDPDAVLTMEEVDDQGIADNLSTGLSTTEQEVLAEAIQNGSATTTDVTLPFDGGRPVEHEGSYYEVETEEIGTETVMRYTVAVSAPEEDDEYKSIKFDELPEVDRDKFDSLLRMNEQREREVRAETSYTEEEAEDSVLVPEGGYNAVTREDTVLLIQVDGPDESQVSEIRYTAEPLAQTAEELADWARDRYLWTLSRLDAGEREVVQEAVDGGYYEGSVNEDFRGVAEKFEGRPAVERTDWGGYYLVEYEGVTYWTDLHRPPSTV